MKQPLKRCPFCGSLPTIDTSNWKYFEEQAEPGVKVVQLVKIECKKCFFDKQICAVKLAEAGSEEKVLRLIAKEGAREVIDYFWNNRAKLE